MNHIERVGGRYAGRMQSWDVVNEAIQVSDGLPGGFRNSPWQKVLGGEGPIPAYIEVAFRTARRVDPKALLVYNDYGIEGEDDASAKKREAVMRLLREMQRRQVPLDALGVQSHLTAVNQDGSVPVYGAGLMKMIAEARAMGLKVMVTELDVNDRYLAPAIGPRDSGGGEDVWELPGDGAAGSGGDRGADVGDYGQVHLAGSRGCAGGWGAGAAAAVRRRDAAGGGVCGRGEGAAGGATEGVRRGRELAARQLRRRLRRGPQPVASTGRGAG